MVKMTDVHMSMYCMYDVARYKSVIEIRVYSEGRVRSKMSFSMGFYHLKLDFPYDKTLQSMWRIS